MLQYACLRIYGLALVLAATLKAEPAPQLTNGRFEDAELGPAWKAWVYTDGRDPTIRLDTQEQKEGRQSLLVTAEDPADVALGQIVTLPPATPWRVRCWIKTENLVLRDRTDTSATVHVQTVDGATLARGASAIGSSTWRQVDAVFRVPAEGRVKIALFFIGYGKGTGRVWFDDVNLERMGSGTIREMRVLSDRLSRYPIDGKQCGQFIELLCNLVPSMLAQQVANTSFEEDPPWKVAFRPQIDKPHRPWYPDGAVHVARFAFDTNQPFNGKRSMRIEVIAPRARAGISQDGFYVRAGQGYRLRLHARGDARLTAGASLHGDGGSVAAPVDFGAINTNWTAIDVLMRATRSSANATLTIDFEGPGTLWLDRVTVTGDDAVLGLWRPDVVEAVRAMRPGVIRFGGSTLESYEWDQCLGPSDDRAPFPVSYWGGLEENLVGVEEFVAFCREVGAEPLVCVRWTGKTPDAAAAEVEYFNGQVTTRWGRLRATHGHPQPWGVKFWQIGNEVGGTLYDASLSAFAEAMRGVDPSILVLSSFPSAETLHAAGGQLDYLCPHHYDCADLRGTEANLLSLEEQIRRWPAARPVRVAVTEWNTTAGAWELGRATLQTLANALACSRYHNLIQRHCDSVEIAVRSNLVDSFGSGVIQTGPGWLFLAPTYYAQSLYARAAGSYPLRLEARTDAAAQLPSTIVEPDVNAVLSEDAKTLRIYAVNSTEQALRIPTDLGELSGTATTAEVDVLSDSRHSLSPEVLNTRDDPQRVRISHRSEPLSGHRFDLVLEPFSLTVYKVQLSLH
jgi:alpha-N-arabinofuranosidase